MTLVHWPNSSRSGETKPSGGARAMRPGLCVWNARNQCAAPLLLGGVWPVFAAVETAAERSGCEADDGAAGTLLGGRGGALEGQSSRAEWPAAMPTPALAKGREDDLLLYLTRGPPRNPEVEVPAGCQRSLPADRWDLIGFRCCGQKRASLAR